MVVFQLLCVALSQAVHPLKDIQHFPSEDGHMMFILHIALKFNHWRELLLSDAGIMNINHNIWWVLTRRALHDSYTLFC